MMVSLQQRAFLALQKDDRRIEHLIEFGEIKNPSIKGKTFVPDPADIGGVW